MTTPLDLPGPSLITLRQRAETRLKEQAEYSKTIANEFSAKKMVHELQIYQIELEMQNEELQEAKIAERMYSQGYAELFEFAPIGCFVIEPSSLISQLNLRGASLIGIERANLIGQPFLNYVIVQHKRVFKEFLAATFNEEGPQACEIAVQVTGGPIWLSIETNISVSSADCLASMIDITERKQSKELLQQSEKYFRLMFEERAGELFIANKELAFQNQEKDKRADELILANQEKEKRANELILANQEKEKRANELVIANNEKDKRADELILNKKHQSELEHIANYDMLTNLPNRTLLADRSYQAMLQCNRHGESLAVVFLDLDDFKAVNDTYGHNLGDELLVALSSRMKKVLRESDTLARFGGDEFVAILTNLAKVEDCESLLESLLAAVSEPMIIDDMVLNVSASVGVTFYPQDNVNAEQLIRHADNAMYLAKESGKNRYHIFDIRKDDAVKVQWESLEAIRNALDNHQFVLYYQPKVNMEKGTVIGFEALIRWEHPERGLLSPIEFLPIIEHHAMIIEVGEWVIDTALAQINQWQKLESNLPLNVSVNIAALQLQQSDFADRLVTLLGAYPNVSPHCLELEVLETSAIDDMRHVSKTMSACIALGVSFALDDFGTGYSSLTYLRRLPTSLIKIDQSFICDMLTDSDDLVIVKGVIALAKSFKLKMIAEGVETTEHGSALLKLGCELAQGYGIASPMHADDVPAWVNGWMPDNAWK
jgi:diguanylate cyclase (GGDEF)-like protein/PAS domain S-box-containing protein